MVRFVAFSWRRRASEWNFQWEPDSWCRWSQRLLGFKHTSRKSRACEMTTLSINHKTFICGSRFYIALKRLCGRAHEWNITSSFFLTVIILSMYQKWFCLITLYSSDLLTFEDTCGWELGSCQILLATSGVSLLEIQQVINHFPLQSLPGRPAQTH